jgi:multidrug resistance efflux pump
MPGENPNPDPKDEFVPITSQADLNAVIAERVRRERGKYSDYGELQGKAAEYDKLVAANQSELEKLQAATATAERERDDARAETLRYKVAAKHGITDDEDLELLTGPDEATLTKLAERLAAAKAPPGQRQVVQREGTTTKPPKNDEIAAFTHALFNSGAE